MNVRKESFAKAKVRIALSALMCALALSAQAGSVTFQGHEITYSGATVTRPDGDDGDVVLSFASDGSFTVPGAMAAMRVLAVGGGGAGGSGAQYSSSSSSSYRNNGGNGGGGGGGVVDRGGLFVSSGEYAVTVGAGGAAAASGASQVPGESGKPSLVVAPDATTLVEAKGGGGGGARSAGSDGGGGGGGSQSAKKSGGRYLVVVQAGGAGVDGQGFAGGSGNDSKVGGGGGGAGSAGADAESGGAGGDGIASDITGTSVVYGGGGGGGALADQSATAGGAGGGGVGGVNTASAAGDGEDGLGGGGGGGGTYNSGIPKLAIGGAGGKGVVIVRISAVYEKPEKPAETLDLVYDGAEHVSVYTNSSYVIDGPAKATAAGVYSATVTLKAELVAQGFTWTDGTTDPVSVTMTISKASNSISGLSLESWIVGQAAGVPSCKSLFGTPAYEWGESEDGPWTAYDAWTAGGRPTEVGSYYVRAVVEETDDYDGAEAVGQFAVWADPKEAFTDSVTLSVKGLVDGTETLADFPVLVRISEADIPGFLYSRAGAGGAGIAFTSPDGTKRYPHDVDVWDASGESLVWVRVPTLSSETDIVMRWRLADGMEAPAYAPDQVWRAFAGVWHFSGSSNAERLADATGRGLTAVADSGASVSASSGGRIGSSALVSGGSLTVADSSALPDFASQFSFYGWVRAPGYVSGTKRFWGKSAQTGELGNLSTGWGLRLDSRESATWLWSGGSEGFKLGEDVVTSAGGLLGFVYDGAAGTLLKCAMFSSPDQVGEAASPMSVATDGSALQLAAGGFALDELRLSAKALSKAWMRAEYLTVADPSLVSGGFVSRDGLLVDWWKTEAAISKSSWKQGEEEGVLTVPVAASGRTVVQTIRNLSDPEAELPSMPTEPGCYRVTFGFDDDGTYEPLSASVDFQVIADAPTYDDLIGDSATLTRSGRVLLMNDDTADGHDVTDQGYWQVRRVKTGGSTARPTYKTFTTFWVHSGEHSAAAGTFLAGTSHDLLFSEANSPETNVIWRLRDVLVGSPYASGGDLGARCALPFSATSKQISAYGKRTSSASANPAEVGNLAFRNVVGAAVYSSCFADGVGTVYFDAVNMTPTTAKSTAYALAVEVTTNVTDGVSGDDLPDGSCWSTAKLFVLKCDGDSKLELVGDGVDEALLDVTQGGEGRFFRIAAKVEVRGACRFRIRRIGTVGASDADSGLVLVDNVVVSYPRISAEVLPFGAFDAARTAGGAPGCAGAAVPAFPGVGEEVSGRARVDVWTNGAAKVDTASFISLSRLNYRWRYLDQEVGEWKQSLLTPDASGALMAFEPLDLPAREGDVEFWFESAMSVPHYEYFDYSGSGLGLGGLYSESDGDVQTNRLSLAAGASLPSCGRDWFFRLRPAASAYERMRVLSAETDGGPVTTNEMALSASGGWRGFVKTVSAPADGMLRFRIEGINPQEDGASSYALATNAWVAAETLAETPAETSLAAAGTGSWSKAPCDAKTGYLLFQVNEPSATSSGRLLVARADCQDFNLWSSGITTNGLYVGTSVDTNATSLVTQTRTLDFSALALSTATNSDWFEDFSLGSTNIASRAYYPRNEPFASARTMRGWTAQNAMWTYGRWAEETDSGLGDATALQLQGRGAGTFSFVSANSAPNGLDTVTFTARLAQDNEFEDFTYYYDGLRATRYTLLTQLAMTESGESSFDGDGSVSLVGHMHPAKGGYEFRISRSATNETLRLSLYKWSVSGRSIRPTLIGTADTTVKNTTTNLVCNDSSALGVAFMSVEPIDSSPNVRIVCGLYDGTAQVNESYKAGVSGKAFFSIAYEDADAPLTAGTYGVLARNCPGVFANPYVYSAPVSLADSGGTTAVTYPDAGEFKAFGKTVATFGTDPTALNDMDSWIVKPGRAEELSGHLRSWGFQSVTDVSQDVYLETSPRGEDAWTTLATNEVSGFSDQKFVITVRNPDTCDVRFRMAGSVADERTDVVLRSVELRQWAAQTTQGYAADSLALSNSFVYTQAWIVPGDGGTPAVRLQPARAASSSSSVALRTPALSGLGLVGFSWRNADPDAVIHLQYATNSTPRVLALSLKSLTDAPSDGSGWVTLETFDFSKADDAYRASGHRTVPLAVRAPACGVFRLVVDRNVVAAARGAAGKEDPLHGSVEIVSFYAWDLPAYDARSWTGWNFRTEGWADAAPGRFANQHDAWSGLSGILNNTLDVSTLADVEVEHYRQRQPSVQTPTFATNCIGSVEFRARLYGSGDPTAKSPAAVVTVYGADLVDANGEPTHWEDVGDVVVTNATYETYAMKFSNSRNFYALRLGVKGVDGVDGAEKPVYDPPLRVVIDDVAVWEKAPLAVAFRRDRVRPFRNVTAIRGTGAVADIGSAEEQPIAGETFGFQAEVVVRDTDEIVVDDPSRPVSVTLWYYPSAEPWGFESWKTNGAAVRVELAAAEGTNLVFRSTLDRTASMCPPQSLGSADYGIVQYQVVATFYDRSGERFEQAMSASEWSMPSWNDGFDDPNAKGGAPFSAFTVIETIAPGRAWINEINYVEESQSGSAADQWVELAIPSGVNMTNWSLRVYGPTGDGVGSVVRLGRGCPGVKTFDAVNRYAFYLVQGPKTRLDGADATWSPVSLVTGAVSDGVMNWTNPFGFELVRPSGIVEHRVVAQGNNVYGRYVYSYMYDGTNLVRVLDEATTGGWTWGAEDFVGYPGCSLGVVSNQGRLHEDWKSPMGRTPGSVNEGQTIDPEWFTRPNSGFCWVDASVSGPHLRQVVGGVTNLTASFSVESGKSTNLLYVVDRWYRLGTPSIVPTTTVATVSGPVAKGGLSCYTLTFPELTNGVRVTVSAEVDTAVEQHLADAGRYRSAILNWLDENAGTFEGDSIKTGRYRGNGDVDEVIGLKGLYWLDLDPTCGGWELWGGMGEKGGGQELGPLEESIEREPPASAAWLPKHTNIATTVWLMITNTVKGAAYAAHPPYRLQGLGNERSDSFGGNWTSVTFKVEMMVLNKEAGLESRWRAMRYFVFGSGSFRPANDAKAPFAARIEVTDPFSRQSPAWEWGWWKYDDGSLKPVTRWNLNEDITPGGVSTLKMDDELSY